jgi:hypothetical protein
MHDWGMAFCRLCCFPFKRVQQWPSMPMARIVLVPMIVYIAKRVIIFVPKFTEKSPFLNAQLARGALSAV